MATEASLLSQIQALHAKRNARVAAAAKAQRVGGALNAPPQRSWDRIVVVMENLPVKVVLDASTRRWSIKRLRSAMDGCGESPSLPAVFVGILCLTCECSAAELADLRSRLAEEHCCYPIIIDGSNASVARTHEEFVRFGDTIMWPLFHSFSLGWKNFSTPTWNAYVSINRMFTTAIDTDVGLGASDMVWVHGLGLLLLPAMIRELRPRAAAKAAGSGAISGGAASGDATSGDASAEASGSGAGTSGSCAIGIFVHTPWPSRDLYSALPMRRELLAGMIAADVVGFHTFDYVQHFNESCVSLVRVYPCVALARFLLSVRPPSTHVVDSLT
jgi:trehalose-6-phosphate synthase